MMAVHAGACVLLHKCALQHPRLLLCRGAGRVKQEELQDLVQKQSDALAATLAASKADQAALQEQVCTRNGAHLLGRHCSVLEPAPGPATYLNPCRCCVPPVQLAKSQAALAAANEASAKAAAQVRA